MTKPFLPPEKKAKNKTIRMTAAEHIKYMALGGAKWFHAVLAKAEVK